MVRLRKTLHPRDDVDILYVSRKEGERGFACIEDSVDASMQRLEDYITKSGGKLITANRNNADKTSIKRKKKYLENKNGKKNKCMDISSDK